MCEAPWALADVVEELRYIYIFFDNGRIEMYISKDIDISFAREGVGCHELTRIDLFVSKFHWCFVSLFLCFGCFSN